MLPPSAHLLIRALKPTTSLSSNTSSKRSEDDDDDGAALRLPREVRQCAPHYIRVYCLSSDQMGAYLTTPFSLCFMRPQQVPQHRVQTAPARAELRRPAGHDGARGGQCARGHGRQARLCAPDGRCARIRGCKTLSGLLMDACLLLYRRRRRGAGQVAERDGQGRAHYGASMR